MNIQEKSSEMVRDELERLRYEYGDFLEVEDEWYLSPREYEDVAERSEIGTLGGAGAWVTNQDGEVLLVRHAGTEKWSEPSGHHEPGESLEETARREVREETNTECRIDGMELAQVIDMVDEENENKDSVTRLILVFSAEYIDGEPEPRDSEIAEVKWWNQYPDNLLYKELRNIGVPGGVKP